MVLSSRIRTVVAVELGWSCSPPRIRPLSTTSFENSPYSLRSWLRSSSDMAAQAASSSWINSAYFTASSFCTRAAPCRLHPNDEQRPGSSTSLPQMSLSALLEAPGQVPHGDDAHQPLPVHDREVPEPSVQHDVESLAHRGLGGDGDGPRGHPPRDRASATRVGHAGQGP